MIRAVVAHYFVKLFDTHDHASYGPSDIVVRCSRNQPDCRPRDQCHRGPRDQLAQALDDENSANPVII